MSGGGGGTYYPQDNSLELERMREQNALQEQMRQQALDQQKRDQFNANKSQAIAGARSTGMNVLTNRGLSSDQYGSVIDQIIQDAALKVPDLDPTPGQYFGSDVFNTGLDQYQTQQRNNANAKVNQAFSPGFEETYLPNTLADPIVSAILGEQTSKAQQQLDFQKQRGVLNDTGYNTAANLLQGQGAAAKSTLGDIADAVLGSDRTNLGTIRTNAGTAASNWTLGMPTFDPSSYITKAQTEADKEKSGLEGDIRSSLGSTQLFDIPTILAGAGTAQGPQNLTTAQSTDGLPFVPTKKNNTNRGLGSVGGSF